MNFESKNPLDIYHDLRNSLERMGITNFGDSSIANIIITLIADNYKENVEHIKAVLSALDFQTATGKDLNAIATLFGLQRIQVSRASSSSYERNIKIRLMPKFLLIDKKNKMKIELSINKNWYNFKMLQNKQNSF